MISFLTKRVWPWVIAAVSVLGMMLLMRRDGRQSEKRRRAERAVQIQRRMKDAGNAVATDRGSVIERLRDGRF